VRAPRLRQLLTFNGLSKDGKVQSKLNFAVSEDLGQTFSTQKINKNWGQNQGSFIAVDPRPGTPSNQGGPGTIYVFWRHFFDPNTIIATRSTDFGNKWSNPVSIIGSTPMAPFDQPTVSTEFANPALLSFRSNGFPTAAVTGDGTVFVAWQERVNISEGTPGFGGPDPDGSPRIVLMRSNDGGGSFSDINGNAGSRTAVDFGDRDVSCDPMDPAYPDICQQPPGFGALPDERPSGPQVMPWLSFGGGRLALVYYESRGLLGGGDIGIQDQDLSPATKFISDIDRVVDFRAALLDPSSGQLLGTTQISRYPIGAAADLSDGEQVWDIAPVNPGTIFEPAPCSPDAGEGFPECQRSLNLMNKPQSGSGGSPFMGDYTGATPIVQFVYDESLGSWRWATEPEDVPYQAFHTIFADNRNLVVPTYPSTSEEWARYQFYGPPGIGGSCYNPGSRNTDVLTARLDAELIVSAPTTYKQLDRRRGFPIRVQNGTGYDRFYRLTITQGAADASFSADPASDIDSGDIQVYPYSSVSQVVYVEAGGLGPIRVEVVEINAINGEPNGGPTGSVVFNPDPDNPFVDDLVGDDNTENPFVLNPFVLNPFVLNPFVLNEGAANYSISNPFVLNPFVLNPFVLNSNVYDVVDTTWEMGTDTGTNTAGSYVPVINIDNAEQFVGNYAFQLIVHKSSTSAGFNDACQAYNISQDQILSNVVENPFVLNPFVLNPFVLNPFVLNESVENPFVLNPFVLNSTFTMAPPDGDASKRGASKALGIADDGTLRAPRAPDTVKVTLRAYQLKPLCAEGETPHDGCISYKYDPHTDPPSAAVGSLSCVQAELAAGNSNAAAACFDYFAPDLVPVYDESLNTGLEVDAGGSLDFPVGGWTLLNQGTADATAENRELRHGFYLTTDETVELDPVTDQPINAWFLGSVSSGGIGTTLAAAAEASFSASSLEIPIDILEGDYNLILYVDDLEEVSEIDEVNNKLIAVVPIFVAAPNVPPVADDQPVSTNEDTAVAITLTGSDADNDPLTFTVVSDPTNGTLTGEAPALTYTPDLDFNGADSFSFSVNDGEDDSNTATVSITINPVNDAPSFVKGADQAVDEDSGAATVVNWATDISAGPADESGQTLSFNLTNDNNTLFSAQPAITADGTLTYTPAPDAFGVANVSVTLSDDGGTDNGGVDTSAAQTFVITVNPVNDAPVVEPLSLTINEDSSATGTLSVTDPDSSTFTYEVSSPPSNGTASFADPTSGEFTYTPNQNFNGSDAFTVTVTDTEGGSGSASVTVTVTAVNDAPVALDDTATVNQNSGPNPIDVLSNDTDVDGDALVVTAVGQAASGSTAISGSVTYEPNQGFVGTDSFTYEVSDLKGGVATATVTVTVIDPVPDWGFVGLLTPWRPNYSMSVGSALPIKWYYTDPDSGQQIDSSMADPEVRIAGPFACGDGEGPDTLEVVEDTGSSDLRYTSGQWQLNWDTDGLEKACYNIRIFSRYTDQLNGPFRVRLR
jgi:VCBS repeat-containing protein